MPEEKRKTPVVLTLQQRAEIVRLCDAKVNLAQTHFHSACFHEYSVTAFWFFAPMDALMSSTRPGRD